MRSSLEGLNSNCEQAEKNKLKQRTLVCVHDATTQDEENKSLEKEKKTQPNSTGTRVDAHVSTLGNSSAEKA